MINKYSLLLLQNKNQRTAATLGNGDMWNYTYDGLFTPQSCLPALTELGTSGGNLPPEAAGTLWRPQLSGASVRRALPAVLTPPSVELVDLYLLVDGARSNMDFSYDYMGRRLFKKVYNNNVLTKHVVFAYDDYKLIAEFDVLDNNNQTAKYLWQVVGLDVPLMRNEEYFVADGNKNILALKDASGNTTVSYNYDPFGKVTASNTHANPFRFSSEYSDPEFGLVYYNYRYYSPTLGRWLNPDPNEEQGGYNLYAMVNNSSINLFDFIGYGGTSDNLVNIAAKNKMLEDINNGNDSSDAVQKYLDGGYHYIVRNQNNTIFDIVLIP